MTATVLAEVANIRARFGLTEISDLPASIPHGPLAAEWLRRVLDLPTAEVASAYVESLLAAGDACWPALLVEQLVHAIDEIGDDTALRTELLELAAFAVAWVDAIDRRGVA